MAELYSGDYVEYDQEGIAYVRCMRCGEIIIYREMKQVECPHCNKMVAVPGLLMQRLPNFRTVRKILSNESYVDIMCCDKCDTKIVNNDSNDSDRLMEVIRKGWQKEMQHMGKTQAQIDEYLDKYKDIKIKEK